MALRTFGWSVGISVLALLAAFLYGGPTAFVLCLILGILEISLSFDNAVVNATVLERMGDFWQKLFLTLGVVIAVFGMRLVFPLLIVGITAHLGPVEAIRLALEQRPATDPTSYHALLVAAHPQIAVFGGMFLTMIFLDFVLKEHEYSWLTWLERPLARVGKLDQLSVIFAGLLLVTATVFLAKDSGQVMIAGVLGLVTYLAVSSLDSIFETGDGETGETGDGETGVGDDAADGDEPAGNVGPSGQGNGGSTGSRGSRPVVRAVGKAGFVLFLYLEVLDASFSFDGVIGAFAITSDPILIALGLGLIGAMFVRSLTVYLVRQGTLSDYVYLEHGAHWAIGALAGILLLSIGVHVNEIVTGLVGVGFIGASMLSSVRRNRHLAREEEAGADLVTVSGSAVG
jgi:hypothetical protein